VVDVNPTPPVHVAEPEGKSSGHHVGTLPGMLVRWGPLAIHWLP
jgi:hypothetical protein